MHTPDFVVIGHAVRDLALNRWRLGGTASFAAAQARKLGLDVGVVTRVGPDTALEELLPGVAVAGRPSTFTTSFENIYDGGRRQRVTERADGIGIEDVPDEWRSAPVALLGPVCGELPTGLGELFSGPVVGVAAQGWLRTLDRNGRVRRRSWAGEPFWSGCRVLFVSDEDLGRRREQVERWRSDVPVVVVTKDRRGARVHARGARVHAGGEWHAIEAFPATEVDPTGAGDVFATAFLVRYHETEDVRESTRFASAAGAWCVEGRGGEGIVGREEIEARMARHEDIDLV